MQSGEAGSRRRGEIADYGYSAERVSAKTAGNGWLSNGFNQECRIASPPQGQPNECWPPACFKRRVGVYCLNEWVQGTDVQLSIRVLKIVSSSSDQRSELVTLRKTLEEQLRLIGTLNGRQVAHWWVIRIAVAHHDLGVNLLNTRSE